MGNGINLTQSKFKHSNHNYQKKKIAKQTFSMLWLFYSSKYFRHDNFRKIISKIIIGEVVTIDHFLFKWKNTKNYLKLSIRFGLTQVVKHNLSGPKLFDTIRHDLHGKYICTKSFYPFGRSSWSNFHFDFFQQSKYVQNVFQIWTYLTSHIEHWNDMVDNWF